MTYEIREHNIIQNRKLATQLNVIRLSDKKIIDTKVVNYKDADNMKKQLLEKYN